MNIHRLTKALGFLNLVLIIFLFNISVACADSIIPDSQTSVKLVNNDACFYFDASNGDIIGISYPFPGNISGSEDMNGNTFVIDGKTKEELYLLPEKGEWQDNNLILFKKDNTGILFSEKINASDDKISLIFEITNQGQEQRWLEPGVIIRKKMADNWQYWNGRSVFTGKKGFAAALDNIDNTFPTAAIFNETEGVAIGIEPLQLLSYLATSSSSVDGENVSLKYSTRVVLDPGQSAKIEFILYVFAPFQHERSAIQKYYELYPEVFRPHPNIDERISLNCAEYYAVWHTGKEEICKRAYCGWDWWYAPFKRAGDIYGHPELWDFEIAHPPVAGMGRGTVEEFHQRRKDIRDEALNVNVLPLFYIPSGIWAEEHLINDYYPDAKVMGSGQNYISKWTLTHTNDVRVFPYGNEYAEALYNDMELVTKELDLSGFSFDTADGNLKIYQDTVTGVEKVAIRAYDDKGIYVDQAVGIALLIDHVHSLKNSAGKNLGVVSNPTSVNYMILFRSDAAIIEKYPWMGQFRKGIGFPARDLLGQKTYLWWHNWSAGHYGKFLLDDLSTEDSEEAFEGQQDQLILRSLTWGMLAPMQYLFTTGEELKAPKLEKALPLMVELILTGLQATSAIDPVTMPSLDRGEIWMSRYQDKKKIYLVVANASLDIFEEPLFINNALLGDYNYVFADYTGKIIENKIKGTKTLLNPHLESREYFVAQKVLGIKRIDNSPDLKLAVTKNDTLGVTQIGFDITSQITTTFNITIPDEFNFVGAFLNGRKVNTTSCGNREYIFEATVFPGDVLEIKAVPQS